MTMLDHRQTTTASSTRVPCQHGGRVPRGTEATYLLIFNDPDDPVPGYGLGWTLAAWLGSQRCWSTALAGHGANANSSQAHAQASAHQVLAAHRVRIAGESAPVTPRSFNHLSEPDARASAPGTR